MRKSDLVVFYINLQLINIVQIEIFLTFLMIKPIVAAFHLMEAIQELYINWWLIRTRIKLLIQIPAP